MQKWCARNYPPTEKRDTITIHTVEMRDTIIYITLPADTITLTDTIYVTEGESGLETPKSYLFTRFAESYAWVQAGMLRHELYQKEGELADTIRNAIRENSTQEIITVDKFHPVEVTPWWLKWVLIAFSVALIGALFRR